MMKVGTIPFNNTVTFDMKNTALFEISTLACSNILYLGPRNTHPCEIKYDKNSQSLNINLSTIFSSDTTKGNIHVNSEFLHLNFKMPTSNSIAFDGYSIVTNLGENEDDSRNERGIIILGTGYSDIHLNLTTMANTGIVVSTVNHDKWLLSDIQNILYAFKQASFFKINV